MRYGYWLLASGFVGLLLLERALPARPRSQPSGRRYGTNLVIAAFALAASAAVVQPSIRLALLDGLTPRSGLLRQSPLPAWANLAIGLLAFDLTFFYWHWALHAWPWLWRFHAVHHTDPDLDVTTSYRFHFAEVLGSSALRVAQVLAIGVGAPELFAYALAYQSAAMFHHANLRLPPRLSALVGWVFITPDLHGVHHSRRREHANSNYGVIFSFWDRLHRTRVEAPRGQRLCMGVPAFAHPGSNAPLAALLQPFRAQPADAFAPPKVDQRSPDA